MGAPIAVAVEDSVNTDELRLRAIAAFSAPIAGAWVVNAAVELVRRAPGERTPFFLLFVAAVAAFAALARRAQTTPDEMDLRSDWSLFFFFAVGPILTLPHVPAVGYVSGVVFAALMVAGYLLERRRLHVLPGVNLARARYASPLSLETCEEKLRTRVTPDDGRFAKTLSQKELLLRVTDDGVALRVRNSRLWSAFLYYVRLRSTGGSGTEIEICPVVSPRAVLLVNFWLVLALSAFLAGVAVVPEHRTAALAGGFAEVGMMVIYAALHLASFRRQKTDALIVAALLKRDLGARALPVGA